MVQRCSNSDLLINYKNFIYNQNLKGSKFKLRCPNTLFKFRKLLNVKIKKQHDCFACPKCESLNENIKLRDSYYEMFDKDNWDNEKEIELRQIERDIKSANDHTWINIHQRNEYNYIRDNLGLDEAIIVIDFTSG
jgi:hypothetical protein